MAAFFLNKNLRRISILALLIGSLILGYTHFVSAVKREHYQLFNTKKTVTWAQSQGDIYRSHVHTTVDNILISEDSWREYVLSLRVASPEDCGIIFDHIDTANYRFFYFKKNFRQIISGQLKDGKLQDIKQAIYDFPPLFNAVLKRNIDSVQLTIDGLAMPENKVPSGSGKIGLIINSMAQPPTVFHNISIRGKLANGQMIVSEVGARAESGARGAMKDFLPFYMAFAFFLFFAPKFLPVLPTRPFFESGLIRKFFPSLLHTGLAVCFFWPFISAGEISVFSYDNLGEIFPLFYYAKHNFMNILQGHAPWLWNPWVHNGFPFFSNHWDMIYYPLNWPVFLMPDKDLLTGLTLKSFLEVTALGIFAYGFFVRELKSPRWALFASVAYQLCSLLIFTMSIFPATSLYFAMTFYLYVLWSVPERKGITNFLLVSLAVVLILTSANVAFIFYACLSLGVISIYRFLTVREGQKLFWLTASGWLTGTLISSVRIFSCLYGVTHGNRLLENFYTIHDRAYMAIRLFVPEIAGWMGPDALNVLKSSNLQLIFRQLELPASNPQNSFFVYFGVLPALLLVASFLTSSKGQHKFWKIYAFVTLGIALFWQPLWGILSILSFPLNHFSYHAVILPAGICTLIGYTGMAWEAGHLEIKAFQNKFLLSLMFVGAYFLVFITYLFPNLTAATRIIFLFAGAGIVLYYVFQQKGEIAQHKFMTLAGIALHILSLTFLILLTLFLILAPIPKKEGLGVSFILPFLWFACAAALIFLRYHLNHEGRDLKIIFIPLGTALVMAAVVTSFGFIETALSWEQGVRVYAVDVLSGFIRVLLLSQAGILAFSGIQKKIFSARLAFAVLLALTAADLVVFNARFNNITAPFYFKNAYYPKGFSYRDLNPDVRRKMDLADYRVNHLDRKDFNANKNLVFNIPSYSGTLGYMTPRFSRLLTAFGYPSGIYMLYPEDSTDNDRFLDLSAVRYSFNEAGVLEERPTALARLNLIYSSEVITDDEALLERLKLDAFDPHKTVLLSQSLEGNWGAAGSPAVMVPISANTPDCIEAKVNSSSSGILLFNESYDEGWKAYLDGRQVPVVRANYNFMACAVGAGEHQVRFVYDPAPYKSFVLLSCFGLFVFFLFSLIAVVGFRKNK